MKRRILSIIIILCIIVTMPSISAVAGNEIPQITTMETIAESYVQSGELPDNDELFAGYVDKVFYGNNSMSMFRTSASAMFGISAKARLNKLQQELYNFFKTEIEKVASGKLVSTVFTIDQATLESWGAKTTWTNTELNVNSITDAKRVMTLFLEQFDIQKIFDALLHDCPYDLYWHDKTAGTVYDMGISKTQKDSVYTTATITSLTASFRVAPAYQPNGYDDATPTVDTSKTGATSAAVDRARQIVTDNVSRNDYQKLIAYRDAICNLVSYNDDAALSSYTGGYGDPWQLIYVFDGDPTTNVVCEGYAKAFQYLCDISTFNNVISCYTVTGTMNGGTGAGGHMWNIVTMEDGKNYLVDVTNSDTGTAGQGGGLFLAGTAGTIANGYTFSVNKQNISFTYDKDMKNLWDTTDTSILQLASSNYTYTAPALDITINIPSDLKYDGGEITAGTSSADIVYSTKDGNGTLSHEWYADNNAIKGDKLDTAPIEAGTYWITVTATLDSGELVKKNARFTIDKADLQENIFIWGNNNGLNYPVKYYDLSTHTVNINEFALPTELTVPHITAVNADIKNYFSDVQYTPDGQACNFTIRDGLAVNTASQINLTISSTNHADIIAKIYVVITDKQDVQVFVEPDYNIIYNGQPQHGYIAPPFSQFPTEIEQYTGPFDVTYTGRNTTTYNSTTPPTNAGDYTATISLPDSVRDYKGNKEISFTIAKATVTITADNKTAYVGDTAPALTYTVAGLVSGDTLATNPTIAYETEPNMSVIGTTAIKVTGAAVPNGNNYNETVSYINGTLTINTKPITSIPELNPIPSFFTSSLPSASLSTSGITMGEVQQRNETITVAPKATISGRTASAEITESIGQKIVTQAKENNSKTVVIVPEGISNVDKTEVSIPAKTVGSIGDQTSADLTISISVGNVKIPNGALNNLASEGGIVTIATARMDDTVTLAITAGGADISELFGGITLTVPHDQYTPGTVAVLVHKDGSREIIRKSIANSGMQSVTIPLDGSATLEIVDNSKRFDDVKPTDWHADAVAFASSHLLFSGTSATTFDPDSAMTRGMISQVLHNLEKNPNHAFNGSFRDVQSGTWYEDAVYWAADSGIVSGYGNGLYGPNDDLTREQLSVMLWRYAGSPKSNHTLDHFNDANQISAYTQQALAWANENGIINGKDSGILDPGGKATRAQVAQMLKNFLERTI